MLLKFRLRSVVSIFGILLVTAWASSAGWTRSNAELGRQQTVYVPIYSNVYFGDRLQPFDLTATLTIRNTDPAQVITVLSVKYYNSQGKMVRNYTDQPIELDPWNSNQFFVKETDITGGPGAFFIVKWKAKTQVNMPIIEAVMIGAAANQGVSFICPGQIIKNSRE